MSVNAKEYKFRLKCSICGKDFNSNAPRRTKCAKCAQNLEGNSISYKELLVDIVDAYELSGATVRHCLRNSQLKRKIIKAQIRLTSVGAGGIREGGVSK